MVVYLGLTLLVVVLGYFVNSNCKKAVYLNGNESGEMTRQELLNKVLVLGIFVALFVVSALRVGIGNDYWEYRYKFLNIYHDLHVSYEPGFRLLVRFMQFLVGYDNYIPIFAVFAFTTCAFFVKALYDTSDWFMYSVFLFMANGFYFMTFDNVRYYLALGICLYSFKYVLNKRYIGFIIWILVAASFHKTALLVIPVYLVCNFLKWSKKTIWLIPTGAVALIVGEKLVRWVVFKFYPYYEGDLLYDVSRVSYANIAKCAAILILCLLNYKETIKDKPKAEFLFNLNLLALILYSCAFYIPEISRVCYYMVIGQVFLIPMVLSSISDKRKKTFWILCVTLAFLGYFAMFLYKGRGSLVMILPYLTWFFD